MGRLPVTPKKWLGYRAEKSWRPYDKPFPCTGKGKLPVLNQIDSLLTLAYRQTSDANTTSGKSGLPFIQLRT